MIAEGTDDDRSIRMLQTLQRLLSIDAVELIPVLNQVATEIGSAMAADKVDIFLYEAERHSLQSVGASATPMAGRQVSLGLDRLQVVNGGLAVNVFTTGKSALTGHADREPLELPGFVNGLGIRSELVTALDVDGERRGVVQALSAVEDFFDPDEDLVFLESVTRWVGLLIHRAELVERMTREARDSGRRQATDEILELLTPRQREIAELIAAGLTNEQIAGRLYLAPGSVANHVERILQKLGVARRTQIAAWIVEARVRLLRTDGHFERVVRPSGNP